MRQAAVFRNKAFVGFLIEEDHQNYVFRYDDAWFWDAKNLSCDLHCQIFIGGHHKDAVDIARTGF